MGTWQKLKTFLARMWATLLAALGATTKEAEAPTATSCENKQPTTAPTGREGSGATSPPALEEPPPAQAKTAVHSALAETATPGAPGTKTAEKGPVQTEVKPPPGGTPKTEKQSALRRIEESVISIDLGASYTKVSFRRPIKTSGQFKEESKVFMLDGSPLIPTLAIRTGEERRPWLFGMDAALSHPEPNWQVFQNWKADLFEPEGTSARIAALEVAAEFFKWLRTRLHGSGIDIDRARVRLAMPAFDNFDQTAFVLAEAIQQSGWNPPAVLKIKEPHANIVGLASQGRNHLIWQGPGEYPLFNYGTMYGESSLFGLAIRQYALWGTRSQYLKAMVVDIGAFTTDIAWMTVNLSANDHEYGDGVEAVTQQSFRYGVINEIDRPLFKELFSKHGIESNGLSFMEFEETKREIYGGRSSFMLPEPGRQIELGAAADQEIILRHLEQFEQGLWEKLGPFVKSEKPEWISFSGGGSRIDRLMGLVKRRLEERGIKLVSLGDWNGAKKGSAGWMKWTDTGENLKRLATALGGASVILDAPDQPSPEERRRRPQTTTRTYNSNDEESCSCLGGNNDCCWCSGSGTRRRQ